MAADTPVECVRGIDRFNREVNSCTRENDESIQAYIRIFVSHEQTYLNLVDAGVDSTESQNCAMKLLAIANVPGQTFSALISSIVSTTRANTLDKEPKPTILNTKAGIISNLGKRLAGGDGE